MSFWVLVDLSNVCEPHPAACASEREIRSAAPIDAAASLIVVSIVGDKINDLAKKFKLQTPGPSDDRLW